MATVRPAAVAGSFYPADPHELRSSVERLFAAQPVTEVDVVPKMVIIPHAGHVYSGAVAASAYRILAAEPDTQRRVALVGPSHFVRFAGMATPGVDALATPLGLVPVDRDLTAAAETFVSVGSLPAAHTSDHTDGESVVRGLGQAGAALSATSDTPVGDHGPTRPRP